MLTNPYDRRVEHVMSKVVITADPNDTMREALSLMEENRITALPIVDRRRRCVGILSATDLIGLTRELGEELDELGQVGNASADRLIDRLKAHNLAAEPLCHRMTGAVAGVEASSSLVRAATEMLRHRVHHLPVIDDQRRLLGIISTSDILNAFVEGSAHAA